MNFVGRKKHYLKIEPKYYSLVSSKKKKFEIRYNDRNYKIGDILILEEFDDNVFTGKSITVEVNYIFDDKKYLKEGYVILGFE